MVNKAATAAATLILAEADFVGSATLVAFPVTVAGGSKLAGAKHIPTIEIVPHAAPVQLEPLTDGVTFRFEILDIVPCPWHGGT
jgi:hypothetical protein